jgi:hypothetical protein
MATTIAPLFTFVQTQLYLLRSCNQTRAPRNFRISMRCSKAPLRRVNIPGLARSHGSWWRKTGSPHQTIFRRRLFFLHDQGNLKIELFARAEPCLTQIHSGRIWRKKLRSCSGLGRSKRKKVIFHPDARKSRSFAAAQRGSSVRTGAGTFELDGKKVSSRGCFFSSTQIT